MISQHEAMSADSHRFLLSLASVYKMVWIEFFEMSCERKVG